MVRTALRAEFTAHSSDGNPDPANASAGVWPGRSERPVRDHNSISLGLHSRPAAKVSAQVFEAAQGGL